MLCSSFLRLDAQLISVLCHGIQSKIQNNPQRKWKHAGLNSELFLVDSTSLWTLDLMQEHFRILVINYLLSTVRFARMRKPCIAFFTLT